MRLEILCGMIASGKSTYALKRAREGAMIISHDDLTAMLHGEYRYESGLRECYRRSEESLVMVAFDYGRDVIIDRTHLTREARKRWIDFAARLDWDEVEHGPRPEVVAVVFPIEHPMIHARRRSDHDARGRSYPEWLEVAEHHHAQAMAEPIELSEGFDRIEWVDRAKGNQ
jgi:predicted kinase